jgi:hypothetical protein
MATGTRPMLGLGTFLAGASVRLMTKTAGAAYDNTSKGHHGLEFPSTNVQRRYNSSR